MILAHSEHRALFGVRQRRQEQCRQDADDGDHNQQLNEGESPEGPFS